MASTSFERMKKCKLSGKMNTKIDNYPDEENLHYLTKIPEYIDNLRKIFKDIELEIGDLQVNKVITKKKAGMYYAINDVRMGMKSCKQDARESGDLLDLIAATEKDAYASYEAEEEASTRLKNVDEDVDSDSNDDDDSIVIE